MLQYCINQYDLFLTNLLQVYLFFQPKAHILN